MAFKLFDRVWETTTTGGTGNLTLLGAKDAHHRSWSGAGYADGDTFMYHAKHRTLMQWESGIGLYVAATPAVQRLKVDESSNAGALVNFSAGVVDIYVDFTARRAARFLRASKVFAAINHY